MRDRDEVRERVRKTFKEIIGNPQPKLQNYRQLLVDIDRISNLDDTESAIRETFAFLFIAMIAMIVFARAHKAALPLNIEIEACKGVLLELHKMKILSRLSGRGAGM
jgi:hypothetical protein